VTILNNLLVPNSDGVHCTTSRNVTIANCNIQAGDDAVIVTGFGDETGVHGNMKNPTGRTYRFGNKTKIAENIVVTNCVLQSRSAGIRVGYGTNDIRNLIFSNLVIFESNRGIGVFARDGHTIENITFDNIHIQTRLHTGKWWGRGEPIHVSAARQTKDTKPGAVRGIRFANVKAFAEAGMVVYGTAESVIENIDFENVELTLANGKLSERYGGNFDMRPVADKSIALFRHDIPGLYAGHVKDLTVKGLEVKWADAKPTDYYSSVVVCENFEDVTLDGIKGKPAHQNQAAIVLVQGKNVRLENSVASPGTGTFVETSKVTGQKIANNDTRNAQKPVAAK
jgi:polygalacturonase